MGSRREGECREKKMFNGIHRQTRIYEAGFHSVDDAIKFVGAFLGFVVCSKSSRIQKFKALPEAFSYVSAEYLHIITNDYEQRSHDPRRLNGGNLYDAPALRNKFK